MRTGVSHVRNLFKVMHRGGERVGIFQWLRPGPWDLIIQNSLITNEICLHSELPRLVLGRCAASSPLQGVSYIISLQRWITSYIPKCSWPWESVSVFSNWIVSLEWFGGCISSRGAFLPLNMCLVRVASSHFSLCHRTSNVHLLQSKPVQMWPLVP